MDIGLAAARARAQEESRPHAAAARRDANAPQAVEKKTRRMSGVDVFIFAAVGVGICFAAFNFAVIQRTKVNPGRTYQPANSPLIAVQAELAKVEQIHATIDTGAKAFLRAEYTICVQFLLAFSVLLLILTTVGSSFAEGLFTTIAFLVGGPGPAGRWGRVARRPRGA